MLVNLAVCDMLVVCVCMPVSLAHQVYIQRLGVRRRAVPRRALRAGRLGVRLRAQPGRHQPQPLLQRAQPAACARLLHRPADPGHDRPGVGRVGGALPAAAVHERHADLLAATRRARGGHGDGVRGELERGEAAPGNLLVRSALFLAWLQPIRRLNKTGVTFVTYRFYFVNKMPSEVKRHY